MRYFIQVLQCATSIQRQHVTHFHLLILVHAELSLLFPSGFQFLKFLDKYRFYRVRLSASHPTPNLEDQGIPFVWVITFDLSGIWCHTSSITTASRALGIIWPRKPHHYVKVGIPLVGCNSYKNVLSQIFKTERCISKASLRKTTHLKKVPFGKHLCDCCLHQWYKFIITRWMGRVMRQSKTQLCIPNRRIIR